MKTHFSYLWLFVISLLTITLQVEAQQQKQLQTREQLAPPAQEQPQYPSLLWRISGNNLAQPSYLFGTMHSRNPLVHELGDSIPAIFDQCKAVALEIVMDNSMTDITGMFGMMKNMRMKNNTLSDFYGEEDYRKVKKYVNKQMGVMGMLLGIEKIKPIFLSALIEDMSILDGMDNAQELPLDMQLQKMGEQRDMKLISIESMEEQLAALDKMPLQDQADMLLEQVNNAGNTDTSAQYMLNIYLANDLDELLNMYNSSKEDGSTSKSFEDAIVIERNYTMANRMDSIIQQQATFNAVGAMHLPGNEGVIKLLQAKGYTVTPVYNTYYGLPPNNRLYYPSEWINFTDEEESFAIDMPAKPSVEWIDEKNLSLYTYTDIENELLYGISKMEISNNEQTVNSNVLLQQLHSTTNKNDTLSNTELQKLGDKGIISAGNDMPHTHIRYRLVKTDKAYFLLNVWGKEEVLKSTRLDSFFMSFNTL